MGYEDQTYNDITTPLYMLLYHLDADIPNDHHNGVAMMTPDEMATVLSLQHIHDELTRESEVKPDHYFMTQYYQSQ